MGRTVVSTSRTPGHTKHFQTIHLTHNVRLCDSPGLVFPSLLPKPLQVCVIDGGIGHDSKIAEGVGHCILTMFVHLSPDLVGNVPNCSSARTILGRTILGDACEHSSAVEAGSTTKL
jgi:hypothetical protein